MWSVRFLGVVWVGVVAATVALGHDHTRPQAVKKQRARPQQTQSSDAGDSCRLTIRLFTNTPRRAVPGVIRITERDAGKPLQLKSLIQREQGWHSMPAKATIVVPQRQLVIEALRGLQTERWQRMLDLRGKNTATVTISLTQFSDLQQRGWRNGNTHLHLMKLTYAEADRYLREVPASDGLDLVFLSHLRRIPDERTYISNTIVENSLPGGDLARLSQQGILFRPGEEHRHNFGRGGEGYGHVMFLDIAKLIRPVSLGPGIMAQGTDGIPLQRGIREAHADGATVVWCHNTFGFEDIPNWMAGQLDAQNIFDGGSRGSYQESFYRYLNLGLQVPFSTGTDWFIEDFSRVYVPVSGELTSKKWLSQFTAGRTWITNGPLLELEVDQAQIGDTLQLATAQSLQVRARATGRANFQRIELIHNGNIVAVSKAQADKGHFVATLKTKVRVDEPGWLALRTPLSSEKNAGTQAGKNVFGKPLYSHTSPVYLQFQGKRIFRPQVARELVGEIQENLATIREKAIFADAQERQAVEGVYREALQTLQQRLKENQP